MAIKKPSQGVANKLDTGSFLLARYVVRVRLVRFRVDHNIASSFNKIDHPGLQ